MFYMFLIFYHISLRVCRMVFEAYGVLPLLYLFPEHIGDFPTFSTLRLLRDFLHFLTPTRYFPLNYEVSLLTSIGLVWKESLRSHGVISDLVDGNFLISKHRSRYYDE